MITGSAVGLDPTITPYQGRGDRHDLQPDRAHHRATTRQRGGSGPPAIQARVVVPTGPAALRSGGGGIRGRGRVERHWTLLVAKVGRKTPRLLPGASARTRQTRRHHRKTPSRPHATRVAGGRRSLAPHPRTT